MEGQDWYLPLKILSYIVLASMAGSMVYAACISLKYWSGIGV